MAITLTPDGSIKADTPAELHEYVRMRDQANAELAKPRMIDPPQPRAIRLRDDEAEAYRDLFRQLAEQPQQQRFLRLILDSRGQKSDSEVRKALGLSNNAELRGLMIGIVRRANGRQLAKPFSRTVTRVSSGERTYLYEATRAFRSAMSEYLFEDVAV
jgi:hypothetical protein